MSETDPPDTPIPPPEPLPEPPDPDVYQFSADDPDIRAVPPSDGNDRYA